MSTSTLEKVEFEKIDDAYAQDENVLAAYSPNWRIYSDD